MLLQLLGIRKVNSGTVPFAMSGASCVAGTSYSWQVPLPVLT